jgi:hypothetical protein
MPVRDSADSLGLRGGATAVKLGFQPAWLNVAPDADSTGRQTERDWACGRSGGLLH